MISEDGGANETRIGRKASMNWDKAFGGADQLIYTNYLKRSSSLSNFFSIENPFMAPFLTACFTICTTRACKRIDVCNV